ncbi:MAG TPA: TPD domain-containing protein, partial [Elusimicrobiota bacterium]|nr:TPD domain-containing protein [Elusimicrobiota bacterium]
AFLLAFARAPVAGGPGRRAVGGAPGDRPAQSGRPGAGPPGLDSQWPTPGCLPAGLVADALSFVRAQPGFAPVRAADAPAYAAEAARLSAAHRAPFDAGQLVALRRLEVSQAIQRAGTRAQRFGAQLAAETRQGRRLLALAATYRLPPLSVARQRLVEEGLDVGAVRAALRDPSRLPPGLGQLAAELPAALEADQGSPQNERQIREASQAFEDAVGAELRRRGFAFRTEAELRAAPGGADLTPDFLLTAPAAINGRPVAWLDAKNQPAVDHPIVRKGLKRAAERYTARFGPGAFVFNGGVLCAPPPLFAGVLLLDGAHLAPGVNLPADPA